MKISEIMPMIREYHDNHLSFGTLHVVLEDENIKDKHINFCFQESLREGDQDGMLLSLLLLDMNKKQRREIIRKIWND